MIADTRVLVADVGGAPARSFTLTDVAADGCVKGVPAPTGLLSRDSCAAGAARAAHDAVKSASVPPTKKSTEIIFGRAMGDPGNAAEFARPRPRMETWHACAGVTPRSAAKSPSCAYSGRRAAADSAQRAVASALSPAPSKPPAIAASAAAAPPPAAVSGYTERTTRASASANPETVSWKELRASPVAGETDTAVPRGGACT